MQKTQRKRRAIKVIPMTLSNLRHLRSTGYLLAAGLTTLTPLTRVVVGERFEGPTMIVFTIPIILSPFFGGWGRV